MVLAQRLYEEGHITYMRTDSTNLSAEAVEAARTHIDSNFGADYLPEKAITYKTKSKNVQEAHEAIRPSSVDLAGDSYAAGDRDLKRLYNLIWTRFVACQMTPARYQSVTTTVEAPASGDDSNTFQMKIQGRVLKFDGYTKVYSVQGRGDKEQLLPEFEVGEALINQGLEKVQHFTKPPARYREASLVRELEKRGDRSSQHLRADHLHDSRTWVCNVEERSLPRASHWRTGNGPVGRELHKSHGVRVHRSHGRGPRPGRSRRTGLAQVA